MTEIDIWLVDAFTDTPLTGNAAGVVLDAKDLTEVDLRRIAGEIGVSETAFVLPPTNEGADFRLRFFTPTQEIDLCGHATIAAFWALAGKGRLALEDGSTRFVQETNVGNLPVWIEADRAGPKKVMMGQKIPRFETPEVNLDKIAALLGTGRKQMNEDLPVEVVSTGLRSLHIPVAGLAGFPEMKVLRRGLLDLSTTHDVTSVQIFTLEAQAEDADVHCRVFAPAVGVEEDPVTGTAAGALGAYLVRHGVFPEGKDGITRIVVEQGAEIGRPGRVDVEVERDDEEFVGVRAGGRAVLTLEGRLRISR
jgi:trans-2,3-dihydro-3-hydroxyanthranilate isomerase